MPAIEHQGGTSSQWGDIQRRLNNTIFAGEIVFNPADFIEHGDLLSGVIPA